MIDQGEIQRARLLLSKAFKSYSVDRPRIIQIMLIQILEYQLRTKPDAYTLVLLYDEFGAYKAQSNDIEQEVIQRDIELQFFACFLQLSFDLKGSMTEKSESALHQRIKNLADKYQFESFELDKIFSNSDRKEAYRRIMNSTREMQVLDDLSLDPFLQSGSLVPLSSLCQYISTKRFSDYDDNSKLLRPMYEIYESLSSKERNEFMKRYMKHNTFKEGIIERSSHVLKPTKSINTEYQVEISKLFDEWVIQIVDGIDELLLELKSLPHDLKKSEIPSHLLPVYQYTLVLESLPRVMFAELILSHLLSKCATESKYEPATVVSICKSLTTSFDWINFNYKSGAMSGLGLTLSQEERVSIIGSLLDIVVRKCTFLKKSSKSPTCVFHYWLARTPISEQLKTLGAIKVDMYLMPKLRKTVWTSKSMNISFPMLVPPVQWKSPNKGGYLIQTKTFLFLSHSDSKPHPFIYQAHANQDLNTTYKVLSHLGSVAWTINPKMLLVYNEALKFPQGFMNITPTIDLIPKTILPEPKQEDFETEEAYYREKKIVYAKNAEENKKFIALYTLREQFESTAMIAQAYAENGEMIYFPHGVDFRGRTYPFSTPLSHHSQDVVRSLLMMWHANPLGTNGFQWLKYHLGALYGLVLPFDERLRFVETHMDEILDSAANPFEGKGWWKSGQKPFQTLALCFEIASIKAFVEKGNKIENYPCRIMVHLDGSCNGLQHYSALGRDIEGGKAVNLIPSDPENKVRGDIYETVREKVANNLRHRLQDLKLSSEEKEIARLSLTILTRKLVKQTVMTSVYGITPYGARQQVTKRISELLDQMQIKAREGVSVEFDAESIRKHKFQLAFLIANATLNSIDELFTNARRIEDWLKENCFRVLTSFSKHRFEQSPIKTRQQFSFINARFFQPFLWYTYIRFLVVQDYTKRDTVNIPSVLQLITLNNNSSEAPINIRKHLNAVPPNFVHSLDSSHLALTCLAAKKAGVTFAAVHDSFWTYPSQASDLSRILRETFVELHSSNILETLVADLVAYTNDSYQLVWICNKENPELVKAIAELRLSYICSETNITESLDNALREEFKTLLKRNGPDVTPTTLVEVYNPKLYLRFTLKSLKAYNDEADSPRTEFNVAKFTPILIPVRLLKPPRKGSLNIKDTLNSTFFFS